MYEMICGESAERIEYENPDIPGDDPFGALFMLCWN
jgi:hypothetical protein